MFRINQFNKSPIGCINRYELMSMDGNANLRQFVTSAYENFSCVKMTGHENIKKHTAPMIIWHYHAIIDYH